VLKRPLKKAHVIQELISLGQQCGTHLASLYPQWGRFREDVKEWRSPPKPKTRKVRRKSGKGTYSQEEVLNMKKDLEYRTMKDKDVARQMQYEQMKANTATPNKGNPFTKAMHEAEMGYITKLSAKALDNQVVKVPTGGFISSNPESIYYAEPKAKYVSEEDDEFDDYDNDTSDY
jgi:hypothetical protein